jgi:hypothetical protein
MNSKNVYTQYTFNRPKAQVAWPIDRQWPTTGHQLSGVDTFRYTWANVEKQMQAP